MAAILMVLMLGATDAVSAQEDSYKYSPEFIDRKLDIFWYSGKPLWIEEQQIAEDQQEGIVQGRVPLYSQLDNVGTEWTSCGPTSLAMALNYLGSGPTPQEVIAYAVGNRGQDNRLLYEPRDPDRIYTSPQHLYEIAEHYGRPQVGWVTDEIEAQEKLREFVNEDLPVIVDVTVSLSQNGSTAAHFVLVTGIDRDNTVYVHDPYGEGQGGRVRAVSWEDFYWAWQNNSDGSVGGYGWWMVVQPELTQNRA
jgi:uncharacterized protein YvpB